MGEKDDTGSKRPTTSALDGITLTAGEDVYVKIDVYASADDPEKPSRYVASIINDIAEIYREDEDEEDGEPAGINREDLSLRQRLGLWIAGESVEEEVVE